MEYDMKKEDDVKEFLDKLGVEYRFNCFSEKKPESCQLLGEYLETIKKDYDKAMKVFRNNCDEYNFPRSCYKYAVMAHRGKGPKQAREEANSYFEKGCSGDYSESCTTGGLMVMLDATRLEEQQKKTMMDKGLKMMFRGCELDNPYACYYISTLYITGRESLSIPKDMEKAFHYADKSCKLGSLHACGNLSQMYTRGEGVAMDTAKGELLKAKTKEMEQQHREMIELQR